MLVEARSEVAHADQKSSMTLAILGVGFGAALGGLLASDWQPSDQGGAGAFFWWVGALVAVASVVASATAVWPRFVKPKRPDVVRFWGDAAAYPSVAALATALKESPVDGPERTRHQLWHLARIASRKYQLVRASMTLAGVSAFLFAISGLLNL